MIIVQLIGGIGNQMFQYAAARRISFINDRQLKLDVSWFDTVTSATRRKYELGVFNIRAEFATSEEINRLRGLAPDEKPSLVRRLRKKFFRHDNHSFVRERHYHFDPAILKLRDNIYLEGYWQSEKYFKDIDDLIRTEFSLTVDADFVTKELADKITASESVSVHIRRGDYASDSSTNQYHGTCSLEYYQSAINMLTEKIRDPRFFIFSDEPAWAKKNLNIDFHASYMDFNGPEKAYEDMRLMSLCKHHIIANSSFSWWGAWLKPDPDKIVIAPSRWFNDDSINTKDLIPDSWTRI